MRRTSLSHARVPMYASITAGFVETSAYGPSASTAPRCSTVIVSQMPETTLMLCSTMSTVRPTATSLIRSLHAVDVLVAHARGGLVEQHQLRVHRERGGDLERALAPVGELARVHARELLRPTRSSSAMARSFEHVERRSRFQKWKLVPRLRCSATRTFSSTVRLGNTAEIWNERIMPRRATSAGWSRGDVLPVEEDGARAWAAGTW